MAENFPRYSDLPPSSNLLATLDWLIDHITANRALFFRIVNTPSAAAILTRFKAQTKITLAQELKATGISCSAVQLDFIVGGIFETIQIWAKTWKTSNLNALKIEINEISRHQLSFASY